MDNNIARFDSSQCIQATQQVKLQTSVNILMIACLYQLSYHRDNNQMSFSKALFFLLIPLIICQNGGYIRNFEHAVTTIKVYLTQLSLVGRWKLTQDSNFVMNKKIEMINQSPNQRLRNNQKVSFISAATDIRQSEAFFDSDKAGDQPKTLYIELYDGKYFSNNTVAIEIDLKNMEASKRSDGTITLWSTNKTMIVICTLVRNKQISAKISTQAKIEIYTNAKEDDLSNANTRYYVKFQSSSFSYYAELQYIGQEYDQLAMVQGVYTFLFLIAVGLFKPKRSVYNISEWMILQAFAFVIVASWMFLRISLQKIDTKLKWVGFCAFVNICLAFFFLRNYQQVLKSFKGKYLKIVAIVGTLTYFLLCYYLEESILFWIFQSFFLLAMQINYSYSVGGRGGLSITLTATLLFMRFPYFYYRFYCPEITRQPINIQYFNIFITINSALLMFIVMQRYFGSRFLIPKELIPDYFNYFQRYPLGDEQLQKDCPICLLKLKNQAALHNQNQEEEEQHQEVDMQVSKEQEMNQMPPPATDPETLNNREIMLTPCNHSFHKACLQEWMQKRLICPIDRSTIPPSERQRDDSYCC